MPSAKYLKCCTISHVTHRECGHVDSWKQLNCNGSRCGPDNYEVYRIVYPGICYNCHTRQMKHVNMIAASKGEVIDEMKQLDQYLEWVICSVDEYKEYEEKVPEKEKLVVIEQEKQLQQKQVQ